MKCEQQLISLINQAYLEILNRQNLLTCLKCLCTKVEENAFSNDRDMAGDGRMHTQFHRETHRHRPFHDSPPVLVDNDELFVTAKQILL